MTASISPEFLALQELLAGRYSIERELGRGGMGIVLLARDVALDRPVAIKLLPLHLATRPDERERFLQEARTAAGLAHPNIVPIHLVEAHGDLVFFVMGFVDGETLRDRVERAGPLPPRLATKLLQEVAWALGAAHRPGAVRGRKRARDPHEARLRARPPGTGTPGRGARETWGRGRSLASQSAAGAVSDGGRSRASRGRATGPRLSRSAAAARLRAE